MRRLPSADTIITREEVELIRSQAGKNKGFFDRYPRTLLLVDTLMEGRRIQEIVKGRDGLGIRKIDLHLNDEPPTIDFVILKKRIWVKQGEKKLKISDRKRTPVEITHDLAEAYKKYISGKVIYDEEYIFPISRQRAWQLIQELAKAVDVPLRKAHPHGFRHFAAISMAQSQNNPMAISDIQDILQHETPEMSLEYMRQYGGGRKRRSDIIEKAIRREKHETPN